MPRLSEDRCFSPEPSQRACARELYSTVKDLPIVSPHGHVDPALLANPDASFGSPADLLIIPDHYVFRMLYSQGVPLEDLGIPAVDGAAVEHDHRAIWQRFADHFHLFAGTPSGLWLGHELVSVFGVEEKLSGANAQRVFDRIATQLARPEFAPRALFERFRIKVLSTTDPATSRLLDHQTLSAQGWGARVRPTFRPDAVTDLAQPGWRSHIAELASVSNVDVHGYPSFIRALEDRRAAFKSLGATATDHGVFSPHTERLDDEAAGAIFARALAGEATAADAARFTAHMLMELARMSVDDGLVMQIHAGSYRSHNREVFRRFGPDKGTDIPVPTEWTRSLHALLHEFGNDARFRLVLFTLDETTFSRELAPLAGHYPAVVLGPPWWFLDSVQGMHRYLDAVVETAGWYNLAGFNDDTRAFCSIPARHDVWRRVSCDWLAGRVVRGLIDLEDAARMAVDAASQLAERAYRL
jgi:glucuronate isomerase